MLGTPGQKLCDNIDVHWLTPISHGQCVCVCVRVCNGACSIRSKLHYCDLFSISVDWQPIYFDDILKLVNIEASVDRITLYKMEQKQSRSNTIINNGHAHE